MAFFGILGKTDTGLKPIVQRAPSTVAPLSTTSAHLVQPKAVLRPPTVDRGVRPHDQPLVPTVDRGVRPHDQNLKPPPLTWGGARRGEDLAHLRRGVVLQARGEHAGAIEAFTKAIEADAGCIEAYAGRGISREALGDPDGARADYARSVEIEVKAGIARHLAER